MDIPLEPTSEGGFTPSASGEPLSMQAGETILGKFKILDLLGQGGMGSVWRVDHLYLGRQFALKCLNKQQANDVSWRRFQNEAKAASKLDHPNLIKVHEFDLLPDGRPFILMDLVKGETLADVTKSIGSMSVQRAVDLMIQVAFAVQYAHDQGIIHRDLKPTNIMVIPPENEGEKESVKLVDFGIAKLTGIDEFNQQTLTKTGEIFGSPLYMSPEQCTGVNVDQRTDIYALGCVFYELLTGAPPFLGENALSTMMKHQTETVLSLKEASMGTSFPPVLEQIVAKLLEKDPNRRYQNANALVVDLLPLTRTDNDPNTLKLLKPKEIIPSRQGQTTQFLPKEGTPKVVKENKSKLIAILAAVAFVFFAAGFATCYFMFGLNQDRKEADKQPASVSQNIPAAPSGFYSEIQGNDRVFRFPPELESLGYFCFDQPRLFKAIMKLEVPKDRFIGFTPSDFLLKNPSFWDGFKHDDFSLIFFQKYMLANSKTYEKLAKFTGLKALNLNKTDFGPADLKYLNPLQSLICLNVGYCNRLRASDVATLSILPKLNYLDISEMKDGNVLVKKVAALPNLRQLMATNCNLTDDDLIALSESKSLRILGLAFNDKITDKGIEHLRKMKQLSWLLLTGTSITPKFAQSLSGNPNLKNVDYAEFGQNKVYVASLEQAIKRVKPGIHFHKKVREARDMALVMPQFEWKGPGIGADGYMNEKETFDYVKTLPIR